MKETNMIEHGLIEVATVRNEDDYDKTGRSGAED
jgi:hypothetical protein